LLKISSPRGLNLLVICRINLKKVQEFGKSFFWKKPECCPKCKSKRLWGHGYCLRYFYDFTEGLWLKRWFCPECQSVHTARPVEYSPGAQYPRIKQRQSILKKLLYQTFLPDISRQIQEYWFKVFLLHCFKKSSYTDPFSFLVSSFKLDQHIITKRLKYSAIPYGGKPPYLPFAMTAFKSQVTLE
jgi:hypothetical protein